MIQKNETFAQISSKVASGVILAVILGLGTIGYAFMSDKVDRKTYETHCAEIQKNFEKLQQQINQQSTSNRLV